MSPQCRNTPPRLAHYESSSPLSCHDINTISHPRQFHREDISQFLVTHTEPFTINTNSKSSCRRAVPSCRAVAMWGDTTVSTTNYVPEGQPINDDLNAPSSGLKAPTSKSRMNLPRPTRNFCNPTPQPLNTLHGGHTCRIGGPRQVREDNGNGRKRRLHNHTRNGCGSTRGQRSQCC